MEVNRNFIVDVSRPRLEIDFCFPTLKKKKKGVLRDQGLVDSEQWYNFDKQLAI